MLGRMRRNGLLVGGWAMATLLATQHDRCVDYVTRLACTAELTRFASTSIRERLDFDFS